VGCNENELQRIIHAMAASLALRSVRLSERFEPYDGAKQFDHFWKQGLYPSDPARADLAPTIYELVRHGLAHAFVTKPMILVTKNKGTKNHLRQNAGVLTVDCLALADDFRAAYERFVRPQLLAPAQRAALQNQLKLILERGTKDSDEHVIRICSAPTSGPTEAQFFIPSANTWLARPPARRCRGTPRHSAIGDSTMAHCPTVPPVRKPKP
jgi:hypothetical protein